MDTNKRSDIQIVWNGEEYKTLKDLANILASQHAPMDENLAHTNKPCSWNGVEYSSIQAASIALKGGNND